MTADFRRIVNGSTSRWLSCDRDLPLFLLVVTLVVVWGDFLTSGRRVKSSYPLASEVKEANSEKQDIGFILSRPNLFAHLVHLRSRDTSVSLTVSRTPS